MGNVSRKSISSQIWDKLVGTSKDNLPWTHLPTNRVVLQRYSGLRNSSGVAGLRNTKSVLVQEIWNELQKLWASAHVPTIDDKNGKKKVLSLINWVERICAHAYYLYDGEDSERLLDVKSKLNSLLDIAPSNVLEKDEDQSQQE